MVNQHKVYCFHCGQRYDQTSEKAPYSCGACDSTHIGVFSQTDRSSVDGYDYQNQAWVVSGRYVSCGHVSVPGTGEFKCDCYGRLHAGEPIASNADIH